MATFEDLLSAVFAGDDRLSRDEIARRMAAQDGPNDARVALDALPDGDYALHEALDSLTDLTIPFDVSGEEPTEVRTGSDQVWDPADFAVAQGWDPTPGNIERARQALAKDGPAAIERTVP